MSVKPYTKHTIIPIPYRKPNIDHGKNRKQALPTISVYISTRVWKCIGKCTCFYVFQSHLCSIHRGHTGLQSWTLQDFIDVGPWQLPKATFLSSRFGMCKRFRNQNIRKKAFRGKLPCAWQSPVQLTRLSPFQRDLPLDYNSEQLDWKQSVWAAPSSVAIVSHEVFVRNLRPLRR